LRTGWIFGSPLGPRGHYSVEYLANCWFLELYQTHDPVGFITHWAAMLEYAFTPAWKEKGPWYRARSCLAHLLGLYAARQIEQAPGVADQIPSVVRFYRAFAQNHLAHDESMIAAMAHFLGSGAGRSLRLEGIEWLNRAVAQSAGLHRDESGSALVEFVDNLLSQNESELLANKEARDSLVSLVGALAKQQVPRGLALQERIRALK
jgi:hypothetical protein